MSTIRILILDNQTVIRVSLRIFIDAQPGMEVVGEAEDSSSALALIREMNPDLIIMNMGLPDTSSIQAIKQLRQECPYTRILILSKCDDPAFVCSALAAGGSGYITKHVAVSDFLTAIHAISQGRPFVDHTLADILLQDFLMHRRVEMPQGLPPTVRESLSVREREIIGGVIQGLTNRAIATRLGISEKTVKTYLRNVFRKLHICQRVDLLRTLLTSPATILMVEDDAGVRETLEEILCLQGYLVYTAATVAEAEAALLQLGAERVQLVIADIQLTPDARACEGYGLYQRWAAIYPRLPFLLMSGDPRHQDLPVTRAGAVRWLTKPFSPIALLDTIQALQEQSPENFR